MDLDCLARRSSRSSSQRGALVAAALTAAMAIAACGNDSKRGETVSHRASAITISANATAAQIVSALQAQPGSPVQTGIAQGFSKVGAALQAQFAAGALASERKPATVFFPGNASGGVHIEDAATDVAIDVSLPGASSVPAQTAAGYVVYPGAVGKGTHLVHRALPNGSEDFLYLSARPATPEVDFVVVLDPTVAGLRLVGGTLEFVDASGAPRLHVAPPYIVGADGTATNGALAVAGCAVDTDASPPWGRPVTAAGAAACTVKVTWPDASVTYPAILDPRWTTTGSMTIARFEHTLLLLSTGKALAVGGRSTTSGTTGLTSAELYDPASGSWAATGSMAGGRRLHSMTQLPTSSNPTTSGKVLVAGGISGTTSLTTAELYSSSSGTWTSAGALNAARHAHTATLLADGRVLVAGGLNGTTTLQTAATYNPASGAGSWSATTGPIPPPGLKSHTATLIQTTNGQLNNKVLVVGGNNGTSSQSSVFLYDPAQNAFSTLASIPSSAREQHTAVVLPNSNGKILVTGGKNGSTILNTAILFDPSSSNGTWSLAGTMTSARVGHSMTVLPSSIVENGSVLVAGGTSTGSNTLSSAELFSGTTTWTATPSLPGPLQGQTSVVLSGNMVLVAGGLSSSTTVQNAAYLYDASFGLGCSSNSQCASGFCVNGICCDTACNGGCGACNLAGHLGTCTAKSSGSVCRAQNGLCDVAETCSGTSLVCPADAVAPLGSVCRSAPGACDVPETCDGTTKVCPADGFKSPGTLCRAAGNACDAAETCTGTSATCPADGVAPAGTVCRPAAGGCDVAETCNGASAACPSDVVASAGTVCRAAQSLCDVTETCSGSSAACPGDAFAAAGTTCGAATGGAPAPVCSGSNGTCPVASGTSDVLGFEALGDWAFDPTTAGSVVGLSSSRTQGASSFEVTAQGLSRLNSAAVSSIGTVGPIVLLDIQLPTNQANPSSYGDAQMFVNSPSLGINNVSLGDIQLTGLALGTWQTLAFQLPAATASTIAQGMYSDLTFSIALTVPTNETGHYLLDNIRAVPDVVPSLLGVAQDGATLKAVFDYLTTSSTPITIPYGTGNGLRNASGFIASPPEFPPTTFVSFTHAPFVATLSGSSLTWTVGTRSVTATPGSSRLPVTTLGDGTHDATLPDGRKVNLDSVPPPSPVLAPGPKVGDPFNGVLNGQLSVSPSGAATYTVPISIPPGIAGMAPNLALAYNSQASDGIAGQGWSLTGLSMITRCPRTMQQDGYGRPVMSDSLTPSDNPDGKSDGICLDGKKLFEKANAPGTYTGETQDFSTITRTGTQFQVVTKAGETRYYGRLSSSNIQQGMWLLDRVVDAWGNYFDIHYNNDQGNGGAPNGFTSSGIWVSKIDYTGTLTNSSCTGTSPPSSCTFASVTFQYECRGDIRWSRVGAIRLPQSQRLRTITTSRGIYSLSYRDTTTHVDGQGCPVGAGPATTTEVSELQSINYCAGSTCTKPLTFGWDPFLTTGWQPRPNYVLPTQYVRPGKGLKGTQFVDINGDGRVDFVLGRANGVAGEGQPQLLTLLNTGTGWGPPLTGSGQTFPLYLSDLNDKPTPVRFADLDGDGRLDVMVDRANVTCTSPNVCVSCPINQPCPGAQPFGPAVWLNRFSLDGTGSWVFAPDYSGTSMTFDSGTQFADLDNDNRTDIINMIETAGNPTTLSVEVIFNKVVQGAHVWNVRTENYPNLPLLNGTTRVQDINRDGYPDIVQTQFVQFTDGSVAATELDLMNKGPAQAAGQLTFNPVVHNAPAGGTIIQSSRYLPHYGDVDGDGFHDVVQFGGIGRPGGRNYFASVGMGDGTGFGFTGGAGPYLGVLGAFAPDVCSIFDTCALGDTSEDYGFAIADINGDGLADLVRNHINRPNGGIEPNQGGGEVLLNTGQTWVSIAGHTDWHVGAGAGRVPGVVPSEVSLSEVGNFLDFDGDGMLDFLQEETDTFSLPPGAWASPYARRVIKTFPSGLAHSTNVTYVSITSAAGASVYKDDDATGANTKPFVMPLMVVSSVDREDASGTTSRAAQTYTYHSLRKDEFGRGPLGFHRVEMFDQASQTRTTTTFAQAYPFTGAPIEVDKYQVVGGQAHLRTKTTTTYCSTPLGCNPLAAGPVAPGTVVFTSPSTVTDIAYLHPESDDLVNRTTTVTSFQFDALGNGTDTITKTTKVEGTRSETFQTEVQNFYETVQSANEGKPTRTVTTATGGTASKTHTTTFEYAGANTFGGVSSRLALTKRRVEPGAGWPIELDTAYGYDQFGNLRTTTSCASDFTSCAAGATNPASSGAIDPADPRDPVHHPPFRTTTISYNPADLNVSVPYGLGRFPTKTTNALGQSETSVYDPLFGQVLSKTGPNGIQTCYAYDVLGRQTSQTERCNSAAPLITTTQYFLTPQFCLLENCTPTAFAPPNSKTVVVTTPPTGAITWTYSDDQGKSTGSLSYAFEGGFIERTTAYNALGQVTQVSKPFHLTSVDDPGSPSYTTTTYDSFNRVDTLTDPLGVIDDSGVGKATTIQTLYNGSTLETIRLVNGQTQNRFETKNAVGKVASVTTVTESGPVTISYDYDAEGNLTFTTDPALNQVQTGYDTRGRKTSTIDPDMGSWTYTVDGFGDVVTQRDAKAQTTTMIYDALGRMRSKTDSTGTAEWVFDTGPGGVGKLAAMIGAPDPKLLGTCTIPTGASVTGGQRAVKSFRYTPFGDVQESDECVDGTTFATTFQYDGVGRQSLIRYPAVNTSQLAVGYHYTTGGFLHYLTDESTDYSVLWQAKAVNVRGQVTDEQMRNGVETVSNRNPLTGWLLGATATAHADGDKLIQNWSYGFDEIGNLLTRKRADAINAVTSSETFTYDLTNRLVSSLVTTSGGYNSPETYAYDALGNLTQKAGKAYTYGGCAAGARTAGPHAVCTVAGGTPFVYDDNGNVTRSGSRSVTYNPSNKVTNVVSDPVPSQGHDTGSVDFVYGADGNRVVQSETSAGVNSRTVYVGPTGKSIYERTTTGSTVQHVTFIYAGDVHGGNAFTLRIFDNTGAVKGNRFYSFDHLGSVTAMSDEVGHIAAPQNPGPNDTTLLGYDAWGARRKPDGTAANPASFDLPVGHRQFTGQEQIPDVGLVNMNGRVYDPSLGRFLSPDPNIQSASDLQSYNRYAYARNNPLRYTDPTGYFWSEIGDYLSNPFNDWQIVAGVAIAVACAASEGYGCVLGVLLLASFDAFVAIEMGAPWDQTIENTAIGLGIGFLVGGAVGAAGGGTLASIIAGSASAAVTTGISNVIAGRPFFEWNMLTSAVISAATASVVVGLQQVAPVSQATAEEAERSGGGGSGASRVEKVETVESVIADAGFGGGDAVDQVLMDAGYMGDSHLDPATKAEIEHTIEFEEDARAQYRRFGRTARSVDELERNVDAALSRRWGGISVAGTTSSSGAVEIADEPNPYLRNATELHEAVHHATVQEGIARFGEDTPEYNRWFNNPRNWAADEVNAYTAGINYLRGVLLITGGP